MKQSRLIGAVAAVGFATLGGCSSGDGGSKGPETTGPSSSGGSSGSSNGGASGSSSGGSSGAGASSSSGAASGAGCGSGSGGGDTVVGNWGFLNPNEYFIGLVFKDDGTFVTDLLTTNSPNVQWYDQKETGTYALSGTTLTLMPEQFTCSTPDPPRSYTVAYQGANLVLTDSSGTVSYAPNTDCTPAGAAVTYGCYAKTNFVEPLAPVVEQ